MDGQTVRTAVDRLSRRGSRDVVGSRFCRGIVQQFVQAVAAGQLTTTRWLIPCRSRSAMRRAQGRIDPGHADVHLREDSRPPTRSSSLLMCGGRVRSLPTRLANTRPRAVYHTIPGSGDGSFGTNYDETTYGHDFMGRQNMVTSPGGTISRTVFDTRGRVGLLVCWHRRLRGHGHGSVVGSRAVQRRGRAAVPAARVVLGTDPTTTWCWSASRNITTRMRGCSGGGGQLASSTQHVDASTTRITEFFYDWRGRQE